MVQSANDQECDMPKAEKVSQELQERRNAIAYLVGSEEAQDLLPPPPGIYECFCERCEVGPDTTTLAQLDMVFRPEGLGPRPGRLWVSINLHRAMNVTQLRQLFAAAGHPVLSRADLKAACDAVLGQRFVIELLVPEGGFNGSDDVALLAPATEATARFLAEDSEDEDIGYGEYEDYDDIPCCGGDYVAPEAPQD